MHIKKLRQGGWENNLQLANDHAELVVSLDVGPRILSYCVPGGQNVLKNYPEQFGGSGESEWMIRGGHRGWLAPEDESRTYVPDNIPVTHDLREPNGVRLENAATAPFLIKKEMEISLAAESSKVTILHRATNESPAPATLATWGLTVMAPGGLEIIPLPPLGQHPHDLLPNRRMILWPYTDLSDARWRFGWKFITLRQTAEGLPTKLGLAHSEKWIGYLTRDALFIKTFALEAGETYPDDGCNFETFSNAEMLEIESLSPLRTLQPGESVEHIEQWRLFGGISEPDSLKEPDLAAWIEPYLQQLAD